MYHDLARIWFQINARSQIRTTKDFGWFLPKIFGIFLLGVYIDHPFLLFWIFDSLITS